ncbi:hypothetical protein C7S16_2938 [Burkholderia thailandensis]|uniref:Uncharacterized protein n=1 Tax=Burkholderia thailandensis TaxID=57975 RepID=A0AAW9CXC4_BURTH|nr:hypothetical protein [Burkholderia thailandensis]MDW9254802.1 hypothetical protein [Burkholderia thailandensis]
MPASVQRPADAARRAAARRTGVTRRVGHDAGKIVYHRMSSGRHARSCNLYGDRKEDSC